MEISIENAKVEDAESITELSGQLGYTASVTITQNRLIEILNNKDHCVFMAVNNKNIVGWIHGFYTLRVESDAFVEIGGLVVNENYRNKGIGKLLVEHIIDWSKQKKQSKVRVRCNTIRTESHKFYESIGFIKNKEQKIFDKYLN
ncbi:GNAT family N-acetyltransferase [Aquimarina sediminis]|uniref:GNAT family N-acetyltransferase n=1 Tax=Aquimarina sediminis TaxID=2070536 RepID=UPI000CA02787|nr:GNAT family N-acetyltransferase [Aquimarina sediminis]